mmetsp:Transcript_63296/g.173995  ORF Transcript_63296/g.173995 Transcript_63296/m.173995 type:complete len:120 (+) Transcript_63296:232-591(+)
MVATAPLDVAAMAFEQLAKNLVRLPDWSPCTQTSGCTGGVLVNSANENQRVKCLGCGVKMVAKRKKEEQDPEIAEMIRERKIRPCPKCHNMTMKEYGICNVINCDQCGIWWNWYVGLLS